MMNFVRKMLTERCLMVIDVKSKIKGSIFFFPLIILLFVLLSSCATTVKYNVSRPAKLAEYGIESIAILPYEPKNNSSTTASPQAVLIMEKLYNRICTTIVNENYCTLIDSNAFKNAQENICDAYITFSVSKFYVYEKFYLEDGSIYQSSTDLSKKTFYNVDDYGRSIPVPLYVIENSASNSSVQFSSDTTVSRYVDLEFSYSVIDTSTNKVLHIENYVISAESEEYKYGSVLPEAAEIIEKKLNYYASKIVSNFQPYYEEKSNTLISDSKNKKMSEAEKLAATGSIENLKLAGKIYLEEYTKNNNLDAAYNYSVLCLSLNELDAAYETMEKVCNESENVNYKKLLVQIEEELSYQ